MPLLKEHVGGRHISAWILTHAHHDHISGFIDEVKRNGARDFDIERIYYNIPRYNEPEIPSYLSDREKLRKMQRERMYGTAVTRRWMDILGVKRHYVTKDGTNVIEI